MQVVDMNAPLQISIDTDYLDSVVKETVREAFNDDLTGVTWSFEQFRKTCCGSKAPAWVNLYIISQFEDEITVNGQSGWYVPSQGRGTKVIIFAKKAKEWMELNRHKIDWNAKLPKG